jgi:PAS domain S-box-containing protein
MNLPVKNRIWLPLRNAVLFTLCTAGWILLSNYALDRIDGQASGWVHFTSGYGMLFVGATTFLLYLLVAPLFRRLQQAETNLRTQDERWKLALEAVGDGVWETDVATKSAFYSPKWKAMLGYGAHEIAPTMDEWMSRIHPDDRPHVEEEMARYIADGKHPYSCEYRLCGKDGTYRWILARGQLMPSVDGQAPTRMIGTHTDISVRKAIEREKDEVLAFTKAVLSSSPNGVIVFKFTGPAVLANESAAQIVGTDVATLLRQNFRELASWREGLLADAERAMETWKEVVYRGHMDTTFGRSLWIEVNLVPFKFEGEDHLLVILIDETGKHNALDSLRQMQSAAQAAPVGWIITDQDGRIEWVNPAFTKMSGYSAEDVVGHTPRILKSGRQGPETYELMWQAIKRGEVWSGALVNKRKNGTLYHEYNTIAPVRDTNGAITHFAAIKQDITGQKQLEDQLARAQRLESIGQLATGMVHDLNNMLSPIMLALGLIRARHGDPETLSHVQMMESAAQRGAGVLRQVLTFARGVEGDRVNLEPKYLIGEVARLAQETFPRQIKIRTEIAPGVGLVSGDLTQLHQVLLNLAVNARDAMPGGGALTFHAENIVIDEARAARQMTPVKPGKYVVLGVRDNGSGIPPEVLTHMFEPFFTTKPHGKGTGLGLSTVYGILRSHRGAIEIETKLGVGTDFCALLPQVAAAGPATPAASRSAKLLRGEGRRILVVDDELAIREVTCRLLEKWGFTPVGAPDGVEALALFCAAPRQFTAVLTDLMMPRMDGYKLAKEIRWREPAVPILASTGIASRSPVENGEAVLRDLGIHTLLHKPYTEEELHDALRREMDRAVPALGSVRPGDPG